MEADFWDERYRTGTTGWDLGRVSPPLKAYIDQLEDKEIKILIPGGGNSYETEYLFKKGFQNVFVADISEFPLKNLLKRVPDFPENQLLHQNFFRLDAQFDLVFEQTFFCALSLSRREEYVRKMYDLLKPEGKLVGLLFTFPLTDNGPPFGGNKMEYESLFQEEFHIEKMERAYNSVPARAGKELFFILKRK